MEIEFTKSYFEKNIVPELQKSIGCNKMEVPRIQKITLNMGVGEATLDKKIIQNAQQDLSTIAGQKAVITKTKKAVAAFKIRENWPIGCKVTLRRDQMWNFLSRLINIVLPRIRDFRGVSGKSFDNNGNYSLGIKETIVFPEIDYDKVEKILGLDICITIKSNSKDDSRQLLKILNFPFKN